MSHAPQTATMRAMQVLSKMFLVLGALIFLIGDKFLRAFFKVDFITAEFVGIGLGLAICLIGAGMKPTTEKKD